MSYIYTPKQNIIADRKNRHVHDITRAIKFAMNALNLLGENVLTTIYLINRISSRVLSYKTLRQTLLDMYPNTNLLFILPFKLFGCIVYVHVQSHMRSKLDHIYVKCIFLGYSGTQKGYKCYCPTTMNCYSRCNIR